MAYTIPNSFSAGTTIEADKVQENNDELRNYINGGIQSSDISSLTSWVEAKHIMKGLYNPIINEYDMEMGYHCGSPNFPIYHPGLFGSFAHKNGGSGRGSAPNTHVDIYLRKNAKVFFYFTISPRPLAPLDTSSPTRTMLNLRIDGSPYNDSQNMFTEQIEVNNTASANEPIVSRYRRRTYSHQVVVDLSAGAHTFELVGQSGSVSVPLKFYTYSLAAWYT